MFRRWLDATAFGWSHQCPGGTAPPGAGSSAPHRISDVVENSSGAGSTLDRIPVGTSRSCLRSGSQQGVCHPRPALWSSGGADPARSRLRRRSDCRSPLTGSATTAPVSGPIPLAAQRASDPGDAACGQARQCGMAAGQVGGVERCLRPRAGLGPDPPPVPLHRQRPGRRISGQATWSCRGAGPPHTAFGAGRVARTAAAVGGPAG